MKFDTPTKTVFYSIEQTIKVYRKFCQDHIKQEIPDLTLDQALILLILNDQAQLSQTEIAKMVFKDHASITRTIELMVQKNYLLRKKSNEDGRRIVLKISAKGNRTIQKLIPIVLNNRKTALNGLSLKEILQLDSTLNKIISNCKKETYVGAKNKNSKSDP